jgi:hypothetical protein
VSVIQCLTLITRDNIYLNVQGGDKLNEIGLDTNDKMYFRIFYNARRLEVHFALGDGEERL